jgi:hypothetical protein
MMSALIMIVVLLISIRNKQVDLRVFFDSSKPSHLSRRILRNVGWITIGFCVHTSLIPIQFSPDELRSTIITIWFLVVFLCALDWIPRNNSGVLLDIILSVYIVFLGYQLFTLDTPLEPDFSVELAPMSEGSLYVVQGGGSALVNHHHFAGSQKYALDIIDSRDGALPFEGQLDIRQYRTFGKTVYSPVEGLVESVENSLPDQKIGEVDQQNLAGNNIVVKTDDERYLLFAHLKQNSVVVSEGDEIKIGQEIGEIGNSGNSTQPHLHIHAMTKADFLNAKSSPIAISFKIDGATSKPIKRNDVVPGL